MSELTGSNQSQYSVQYWMLMTHSDRMKSVAVFSTILDANDPQ